MARLIIAFEVFYTLANALTLFSNKTEKENVNFDFVLKSMFPDGMQIQCH